MKICFVTIGNIQFIATMKRALGMADLLDEKKIEVHIIAEDCIENKNRIALECSANVYIHYYKSGLAFKEVRQKTTFLNDIEPEVAFFCSFGFRNRINKFRLKKRIILLIEHSELQSGIPNNKLLKRVYQYLFEIYSIFFADGLICASTFLIKIFKKRCKFLLRANYPLLYLPYAYNSKVLSILSNNLIENILKGKYSNNYVILYIGSLTSNYGLFTMLEAVAKARISIQNIKLLLIGNGRNKDDAIKYCKDNNLESTVEFAGYVKEEDLNSYFKIANLFISPLNDTVQDWARCPSKIYMYLPYKKPILTCKIGEASEIFGENGYYFNNNDSNSLFTLILKTYNNKVKEVASINYEMHNWESRTLDFTKWLKVNKWM